MALRTSTPAAILPPAVLPTPVSVEVSPQVACIDDAMKQQMVEGLAAQSGMNVHWAKKCLTNVSGIFNKPNTSSVS
jgi:hypothetical protein